VATHLSVYWIITFVGDVGVLSLAATEAGNEFRLLITEAARYQFKHSIHFFPSSLLPLVVVFDDLIRKT